MKSAAEYPEYQGDPENIQFLTRNEHLAAHKGSWQNPTNWYYNPETKEFIDFGENKPIPCEAINLSEPVCSPVIDSQNEKRRIKREVHESFGDKVLRAVDAVRKFSEMHPILTGIVKWGGIAAAAITTAAVANNSSGGGRSSGDGGSDYSSSESFDDYSADDGERSEAGIVGLGTAREPKSNYRGIQLLQKLQQLLLRIFQGETLDYIGSNKMVTFKLIEKSEEKLIYRYYPEGNEDKRPGTIIVNRLKEEIELTELAEDDWEREIPAGEINELIESINQMKCENGETDFLDLVTEPKHDVWYGDHALGEIMKHLREGEILEKGMQMWY